MPKFLKSGKVVVLLTGRHAGKKVRRCAPRGRDPPRGEGAVAAGGAGACVGAARRELGVGRGGACCLGDAVAWRDQPAQRAALCGAARR